MSGIFIARFDELEAMMASAGGSIDLEIPTFRIKRSHKKSRLGCVNCKRRRVKCDEKQPSCDRCHFRGLTCEYAERPNQTAGPEPSSSKSGSTSASPGSHTSTEQIWSPGQELWNVGGVTDTELFRHFLANTVDEFVSTSTRLEQTNMWRAVIPSLALNSHVVRRGILTLAAMHLHHLHRVTEDDTAESSKFLEIAEYHGEIFVRESRRQLRELQPSEIDNSVACSRLLGTLGLVFYHVHRRNGAMLTDGATWTWLQLIRGVKPVSVAVMQSNQPVDPAFAEDLAPEIPLFEGVPPPPSGYPFIECSHPLLGIVQASWPERRTSLEQYISKTQRLLTEDNWNDLDIAVGLLDKVSKHLFAGQMHSVYRTVITWAAVVPKGFMDMLMRCVPAALAIYTHWLVLMVLLEDYWWISDMGRDGIREILALLSDESPEIQALIHWSCRIAGLDSTIISPQDASIYPMLM